MGRSTFRFPLSRSQRVATCDVVGLFQRPTETLESLLVTRTILTVDDPWSGT